MTLSTQFITMLTMISMGIVFGAAFDTYNRFLKRQKRKSWLVFLNDVLFWTLQGLWIFIVLFRVNQGELRFYIFIALICGFAAYQALLKEIYLKILDKIIQLIVSIYTFFVKLVRIVIYRPIVALLSSILALFIFICKSIFIIVKWIFMSIWFVLRIVFRPILWILLLIWKLFPNFIKKAVEKLYNTCAGYFSAIKKYLYKWISKWKRT